MIIKKVIRAVLTIIVITGVLFLFYSSEVSEWFNDSNSEEGILVVIANSIIHYWNDAEGWNHVFLIIFLQGFFILVVVIDFCLQLIGHKALQNRTWYHRANLSTLFSSLLAVGRISLSGVLSLTLVIVAVYAYVITTGNSYAKTIEEINSTHPVLVLGTSKLLKSGNVNKYYSYRIEAAQELWTKGKAKYFIISGDRTAKDNYDETKDIKEDLLAVGIPDSLIKIDTAGYRTLDSMLRLREYFKTKTVIIVSQEFHVQRAVHLATFYNVNPIGFNAKGTMTNSMMIRELAAKPKMVADLYFWNMQPRVGKSTTHHEELGMKSNAHVALILFLFAGCFFTSGLIFKFFF